MKRLIIIAAAVLLCMSSAAQDMSDVFARHKDRAGSAPFIVISKQDLRLVMFSSEGKVLKDCGISCARTVGAKERRGDHKTPEGVFKINELLRSEYLTHDFGDGKGPVKGAYGPWFLRLDVPGYRDIGIHGTHKPESIGTRDTEGCIRLVNDNIVELKGLVKVGTPVIILKEGESL